MASSSVWSRFIELSPTELDVADFAGNKRRFKIGGSEREGSCFSLHATEMSNPDNGYRFQASSYSSPHEAMATLANKVRSELSVRHLEPLEASREPSLLANRATGRVTSDGVVIDGMLIPWSDFTRMASTYEGWEFALEFRS